MTALLIVLASLLPQDSDRDKLKSFEKSVDRDRGGGRGHSSDDRKREREEHLPGPPGQESYSTERIYSSDGGDFAVAEFIFYPFIYPFLDNGRRFDRYPYGGDDSYFKSEGGKTGALHLSTSAGWIESGLTSLNIEGVMSWRSGCDLRFDLMQFEEKTDGGTDRLELQQFQLNFALTSEPNDLSLTLGFGVAWLEGEAASETGFTTQVNVLWLPFQPLGFRFYAGHLLFEDASVGDLRAEFGIHLNRFAVTGGIRSLVAEGGEDLTGPTLGLAVFF